MNNILHDSNLKITSLVENFMKNSLKNQNNQFALSDFTDNLMDTLMQLGKNIVTEVLNVTEEAIFESKSRQNKYGSLYKRSRDIITIFGKVSYERRLYYEIGNESNILFLTDNYLDILKGERLLQNVDEKLLNVATESNYEKAGKVASYGEIISKQTVKNKLNELNFNASTYSIPKQKKINSVIYVQADEDHVSLQSGGCVMPRIVTIHEGSSNGKLMNPYTIAGVYDEKIDDLWEEVLTYIENNYAYEKIQKIILMGDGASWIKTGLEWLTKSVYVADKFHIFKAITTLSCGNLNAKDVLLENIFSLDFEIFELNSKTIIEYQKEDSKKIHLEKVLKYVLNNKEGIKKFILWDIGGCSAEGHVSHILSARLSSRPLGWSVENVNSISKLRAMKANKEDIRLLTRNINNMSKENVIEVTNNIKIRKSIKKIKYNDITFSIPEISFGDKEYRMKLKELIEYKAI